MPRVRLLWAGLALVSLSLPVLAAPGDGESIDYWLEKMAGALRTQNYEGIFTYMRGQQFDTVQVVHRFEDGKEIERLLHLNGQQREIIRRGDVVVCRHEESGTADLNHEVPLGPFTHSFNENLSSYQNFYDFALEGADRVAGRQAIKLAITPRYDDRWGYRLWLDEETGLLLQSHLVGRGRVLEVFQFSRVEIGQPIDDADLETALAGNVTVHQLSPGEADSPDGQMGTPERPQWKVAWLPRGFRQVPSPRQNRIVFTDGLATFSVFIDRSTNAAGEIVTHMGGTAVITRRLKNSSQQITVVGEVPVDTAKKVADSIEPVVY